MPEVYARPQLGIPEMDAQHAYLYALFDRIGAEMTYDEMAALLHEIEGYLDFHFTSEEHLIRHYKAPGFALHQSDHEQAAEAFLKHLAAFEQDSMNPARLKNAMTGWLAEHSLSTDMEYAEFIRDVRNSTLP